MPKDPARNVDRYKIGGGTLNEFDFQTHQTEMAQQERALGRTTVLKTIQRLEAKGLLARLPGTGPVQFRASIQEHKVLPALIGRFVEGVLGGSAGPLVAYLAGSDKLSAKDLEALRGICRKLDEDSEKP